MGSNTDLARMRLEYETVGLAKSDMDADPFAQFDRWIGEAIAAQIYEPNAMVVSTVDEDGQPSSRFVLLKGAGSAGFDFFTNYNSNKSADLNRWPRAAATFGWLPLHRQVNIAGAVITVPEEESDAYWSVRTRGSQLGAWASGQSSHLKDRSQLLQQYEQMEKRYPCEVPRPPHWGGWRIVPNTIEFWQGRQNRLHDRLRYTLTDGAWEITRLSP